LLAEDNIVNQQVGLLMISQLGYSADMAPDGQLAVNAVDKVQYDLILMDIQVPNMNGIDAARKIRDKLGDSCPLIFALTAEAPEGDKQRFLGLGFDGYLSNRSNPALFRRRSRRSTPTSDWYRCGTLLHCSSS
jgi:CheY-like chemotaxis protein